MYRKHKIFLLMFLVLLLLPISSRAADTEMYDTWVKKSLEWCRVMEKDGDAGNPWQYQSGKGEYTSYLSARAKKRYTNCALMVTHALQYSGIFSTGNKMYAKCSGGEIRTVYNSTSAKTAIEKYCDIISVNGAKTAGAMIKNGELKKGDIICFYGMQHTAIYYGQDSDNLSVWLDAGRSSTSTASAGGIWNSVYSFVRKRNQNYLCTDSWKINEIIRVRQSAQNTSASSTTAAKQETVQKTEPFSISAVTWKIKKNKLYISFSVKNNLAKKAKIKIKYLLGTSAGTGSGKNTKTVVLGSKKTKKYKNILVSLNKVTATRCYLTIKASSGSDATMYTKTVK